MKFDLTVALLLLVTGTVTVKGKMTGGQQALSSNANCYHCCYHYMVNVSTYLL